MAPLALHGRADVLTVGVITEDGSPLPSGIACTQSVHTTQFDDWIGARPLDRENKVRVLRSGFVDRITCGAPGQQGNLEISPGSAPSNLVVVVRRK
jgi:hypothetical protein